MILLLWNPIQEEGVRFSFAEVNLLAFHRQNANSYTKTESFAVKNFFSLLRLVELLYLLNLWNVNLVMYVLQ